VGTALLYELIVTERLAVQKIVVASSQAVYGEGAHLCPVHGPTHPDQRSPAQLDLQDWAIRCSICGGPTEPTWTSEAVAKPHNSYGLSKRDQEDVALILGGRYAIPSVALRYSIVQGPRQSFQNAYSGALRAFAVRALTGGSPVLFEDGEQLRDYVSVHDVVRANLLVLEDERAVGQVFNVGGDRKVSVRELADLVVHAAGSSVRPVVPGVFRVGDTRHIFSDVSRLKAIGWEPLVDQTTMVNEYLAWASDQPDLSDTFEPAQARMRELGVLRTTQ
jgi:dTDP-L-rhamnose 4-epimerase